jgi:twinkle protein
MDEIKEYLNIKDENPFGKRPEKHYTRPTKADISKAKPVETKTKVMQYLEGRGLTEKTIKAFKIGQSKDDTAYIFPYYDEEGLAMTKTVMVERENGKKKMWATRDSKSVLFGKNTIPPSAEDVIITEGELDAASWFQQGQPAVSIPQGASNDNWIENEWSWLDRFETIYLNFDSDDAGQKGAKSVASRLGYDRVKNIVLQPYKDANEMLLDGEDSPDRFIYEAKTLRPPEIQSFYDGWDEHAAEYEEFSKNPPGILTPWSGLKWRIRRKEVTAVSGYTFHGKTAAMTHLICHLQSKGWNGLIASLEMESGATRHNMTSCVLGSAKPTLEDRMRIKDHPLFRDMLLVVQERGRSMNSKKIVENYKLCVKRYGIDYFVLDNMMMCEVGGDDYDAQRDFVLRLQDAAIETNTHVFLVSHPKKPPSPKDLEVPPNIYDIKGASEVANLANNFISVWRNIKKHKKINELEAAAKEGENNWQEQQDWISKPDGIISLSKQRGGFGDEQGWQGEAKVWMKAGKQFVSNVSDHAMSYIDQYDINQV